MKTVFIINPCAGDGKCADAIYDKISTIQNHDTEVYCTKSVGDATEFVRRYCKNNGPARFIACGGDGTLNEVLNGIIGIEGAEVGVIPIGTGNDFCRNFECSGFCDDVSNQIQADTVTCDAIKYIASTPSGNIEGYCANMFNIGFDCNVADMTASIRRKSFVSGSAAYLFSVFAMLLRKKGANLKIEVDGIEKHQGKLLLTSIANGCYCGGGIKSNPLASISDGKININIIKNVSRLRFLSLLPSYMKGTFLKAKNINRFIQSIKCTEIDITPLDGIMKLCIDGEIIDVGKTHFEICHNAFDFVVSCERKKSKKEIFV